MVVTDGDLRKQVADCYRKAAAAYVAGTTGLARTGVTMLREYAADDVRQQQRAAMIKSGGYLMENLERAPVFIIPCIETRFEQEDVFTQASMWGSILPATWSLMLALRARRIASAWTTLHLVHEREVAELLGIPADYPRPHCCRSPGGRVAISSRRGDCRSAQSRTGIAGANPALEVMPGCCWRPRAYDDRGE